MQSDSPLAVFGVDDQIAFILLKSPVPYEVKNVVAFLNQRLADR
jgi:hypothetical protein